MPQIEKFDPVELGPKLWGREMLVAHTPLYTLKVLYMRAGHSGPLQYHQKKDEAFHLLSGKAVVEWQDTDGTFKTNVMREGESYHIPPGAVHRVEAIEDCVFVEASNPVFDDRVAVKK